MVHNGSSTKTTIVVEATHAKMLRRIVAGGLDRKMSRREISEIKERAKQAKTTTEENALLGSIDWSWKLTNSRILEICRSSPLEAFIRAQRERFFGHQCRIPDWAYAKQLSFTTNKASLGGNRQKTLLERILVDKNISRKKKRSPEEKSFLKWCMEKPTQSASTLPGPKAAVPLPGKTNK